MTLRRARQDLDHLTSWLLLAAAATTIVTGLVVHLWDLHGFVWHTYAGYVMTAAVLVHVALNLRQLTAYAGFRLRQGWRGVTGASRTTGRRARRDPTPATAGATARRVLLSRRGLVGLALGGAGGWLIGQSTRATPQLEAGGDLGLVYHRWSSDPGVVDAVGALRNLGRQPPLYKSYGDAMPVRLSTPAPMDGPDPSHRSALAGGLSTEQAIGRRRSIRAYAPESLTEQELSRVLALTGGLTGDGRRSHPSSGALYPIETYAVVHRVDGIDPGVYHYGVEHHVLHRIRAGDFRQYVVDHGLNQEFLGECAVVIYLTMIFQRMRFKYGERSYRYGLIEAGHLGQSLYLSATSLGLGVCAVGAYDDPGVERLLGIDGVEEVSVYLLSLGRPA